METGTLAMGNRRHRIVATMRQTEMLYHWTYRATSLLYAQEPDRKENWHPRLVDSFQVFCAAGERLLPAKLKVSFPLFGGIYAVPVNVG